MEVVVVSRRTISLVVAALAVVAFPGLTSVAGGEAPSAPSAADVDDFDLVAVTESVVLTTEELEHVRELRRAAGVTDDPAVVSALYTNPVETGAWVSTSLMFGATRVVAAEMPALRTHALVSWYAATMESEAEAELGGGFAGAYVDGTSFAVRCAGCDAPAAEQAIRARVPAEVQASVRVEGVAHSLVDLVGAERDVNEGLATAVEAMATAVDVRTNRVVVEVADEDAALAEAAIDDVETDGVPVDVEATDSGPEDYVNKNDFYAFGLVGGGMAIKRMGSGSSWDCTSSLPATSAVYGDFLLTAGHCGNVSSTWRQGGSDLGTLAIDADSGNFDAAAISTAGVRPSAGNTHWTSSDYWHPLTFTIGLNGDAVGQTVCHNGAGLTGLSGNLNGSSRCGVISSRAFDPGAGWSNKFRKAGFAATTGDSGATVVWPTIFGHGAAGIIKGGNGSSAHYSHLPHVLQAWGLTVKAWA